MVSEVEDIMEVSQAISTNFIRQNMEEVDICEHSCEQLSSMVQELKGLRIVVGNLMDGLQKVVSFFSTYYEWSSFNSQEKFPV